MMTGQSEFEHAVEHAQMAFWNQFAACFPQVTGGDLDPLTDARLDEAMRHAAKEWLDLNWPEGSNPPGWTCWRCGTADRGCDRDECRSM
jgi:hypothetical protein